MHTTKQRENENEILKRYINIKTVCKFKICECEV
jgi:hypothetical protein